MHVLPALSTGTRLTMLVSTGAVIVHPISLASFSSHCASWCVYCSLPKFSVKAVRAADVSRPACLNPAPNIFRKCVAFFMNGFGPIIMLRRGGWRDISVLCLRSRRAVVTHLPMGAPSPLLKHRLTLSNGRQSSSIVCPVLAETFHNRAPSRCSLIPSG
jgi:hypothetical protein